MLFHNLLDTIYKKNGATPRVCKPGVVNIHSLSIKTLGEIMPRSSSEVGRIGQQLTPVL